MCICLLILTKLCIFVFPFLYFLYLAILQWYIMQGRRLVFYEIGQILMCICRLVFAKLFIFVFPFLYFLYLAILRWFTMQGWRLVFYEIGQILMCAEQTERPMHICPEL